MPFDEDLTPAIYSRMFFFVSRHERVKIITLFPSDFTILRLKSTEAKSATPCLFMFSFSLNGIRAMYIFCLLTRGWSDQALVPPFFIGDRKLVSFLFDPS